MTEPTADIDVLVIGGGAQGLICLCRLVQAGYRAALITDAPLGSGQTLHSHGWLYTGYTFPVPALANLLQRGYRQGWAPFLARRTDQTRASDRAYLAAPSAMMNAAYGPAWQQAGLAAPPLDGVALPPVLQGGLLSDPTTALASIEDFTFDKCALVRGLAEGLTDRIVRGTIEALRASGEPLHVNEAVMRLTATGERLRLRPRYVVACVGVGVPTLLRQIEGGDLARLAAVEEGRSVHVARAIHIVCLRGPASLLPPVALFHMYGPGTFFMIAPGPTDGSSRLWHVTDASAAARTYLLTDQPVAGNAEAPVSAALVRETVDGLFARCPSLRQVASELEWQAYAGWKSDVPPPPGAPLAIGCKVKQLDTVPNLCLCNPNAIALHFEAAEQALRLVQAALGPGSGVPAPLPGGGIGIELGRTTDQQPGAWQSWSSFAARFESASGPAGARGP